MTAGGGLVSAVLLLGALALPMGCSRSPLPSSMEQRLPVLTTVVPMTLLTQAVGGNCVVVTQLLPPTADPHDFKARPGDLLALERSRVLVKNGLGLEAFLPRLLEASQPRDLVVIEASRGVVPIPDGGDSGDHPPHSDSHHHGADNPHVWLDPLRAAQQVEAIRDGLVKADPGCADQYRRNASRARAQLIQLDRHIAGVLAPYRGRTFVTFHAVAPYFAERYGLKAAVLVETPEQEPAPADLQRVTSLVRRNGLGAFLHEPDRRPRSLEALAKDLGLQVRLFDPLEAIAPDQEPGLSTYLQVMRRNAHAVAGVWRRP